MNMTLRKLLRIIAVLSILAFAISPISSAFNEEAPIEDYIQPQIVAFQPGETLKYTVSWSQFITAGTAVMEVKEETLADGRRVLHLVATGHSTGLVGSLYPVTETAMSVFDPSIMQSISYSLREQYGKKVRRRIVVFDHGQRTVVSKLNDDTPVTVEIPDQVQDGLASLYYLRTREDLKIGKTIIVDVLDSEKNWSVEFQVLGRETLKTPVGEFSTIKVRTYPKYKGVFQNKGEAFIWLTDDSRRVPVLIKSKLKVGSFVLSLDEMKL